MLKDMSAGFTVLKIFAESTKVVIYALESITMNDGKFKSNLTETIGGLQDVLENLED